MRKDKKDIYKTEIEPLVQNIVDQCKKYKMPMFITVCTNPGIVSEEDKKMAEKKNKNNTGKKLIPETDGAEYETNYVSDFVTPFHCGEKIKNDYVAECIKATNGFPEMKKEEDEVIDLNDLDTSLPESFL